MFIFIGCLVSRINLEMKFDMIVCRLKLIFIDSVLVIYVMFCRFIFKVVSVIIIISMLLM